MTSPVLKVLSFDPGQNNFAFSVSKHKYKDDIRQAKVLDNGIIQHTITNLNKVNILQEQTLDFINEVCELLDKWAPFDLIAIERFMGRGIKVGTTSETTNIMIGILTTLIWDRYKCGFPIMVNPAQWKKAIGKESLAQAYSLCGSTAHQLDASLIGYYVADIEMSIRPFDYLQDEATRDRYLYWIEKTSREKLVNRRNKRLFFRLNS